jgi:hypothetical protein
MKIHAKTRKKIWLVFFFFSNICKYEGGKTSQITFHDQQLGGIIFSRHFLSFGFEQLEMVRELPCHGSLVFYQPSQLSFNLE